MATKPTMLRITISDNLMDSLSGDDPDYPIDKISEVCEQALWDYIEREGKDDPYTRAFSLAVDARRLLDEVREIEPKVTGFQRTAVAAQLSDVERRATALRAYMEAWR